MLSSVFLLGAGFSIGAGMPTTNSLYEKVFSENWQEQRSGYGIWKQEQESRSDEHSQREVELLRFLETGFKNYHLRFERRNMKPNYEDLSYLAGQIEDSRSDEVDNPAVGPLMEKVIHDEKLGKILNEFGDTGKDDISRHLSDLAGNARHMIYDVVWTSLIENSISLDNTNFILEAAQDKDISCCNIFTPNHDLLLESLFRRNNVPFLDGFENTHSNFRIWKPDTYDYPEPKDKMPRIYKLHGSLNWALYDNEQLCAVPIEKARTHFPNTPGPSNSNLKNGRPLILVGTFDKLWRYTEPYFLEMQYRFMNALRDDSTLVVCGYSFRDRGINAQIIHWMLFKPDSRMIVIHAKPDALKANARGAIRDNWDEWFQDRKLEVITKWAQDVEWEEIKTLLQKPASNETQA